MSGTPRQWFTPFIPTFNSSSFSTSVDDVRTDDEQKVQHPCALQIQLCAIAERIPDRYLRAVMLKVFADIARLMDNLRMINWESGVRLKKSETIDVLRFVRQDCRQLTQFMSNSGVDAIESDELFDAFEVAVFAIKHELSTALSDKFFEAMELKPLEAGLPDLNRARGVIYNSLQQSLISIAKNFDPFVDALDLFDELKLREVQSRVLLQDLTNLIAISNRARTDHGFESTMHLLENLEQFRGSSMRYLMCRDWEDCENEMDQVIGASVIEDRAQLLEGFVSYLQTLVRHVSLRTCLAAAA